jgi:hypothetical protein
MIRSLSLSLLIVGALALPLSGCARSMQVGLSVWCDTNRPTEPTRAEYTLFTHEQKVGMADHNEFGEKYCGWKPSK